MATTDPRDLARIEATHRVHPELATLAVLELLAKELPKGVVASGGNR